ncbi:MAG: hypothetical protein WCB63_01835 [Polyangiales bacterium]
MLRASGVLVIAVLLTSESAKAGNSEDVVAGSDVALTGGAVVANVHTGGAMWFNPAGVARLDSRSVDLTGAVLSYSVTSAPGALSLGSGEQSAGDFSAIQAIPRALTFVASPRPALRWGVGLFFSRSQTRYLQDSVASDSGSAEPSEFYATTDDSKSLYHLSSAIAWKKSEKFLLGGGFDIVVATQRLTRMISGGYAGGAGGTFGRNFNQAISGGGLQIKGGLQWAPIEQVRIGWMAATPSYLVYLNNKATTTQQLAAPTGAPAFEGTQIDDLSGTWSGVEAGLTRLGAAFLGGWGWVEADVVVHFPLKTSTLDIKWKTTTDVRLGGIFRLTDHLKLGAGFFTDFSPEPAPDEFGDTKINFYGFTLGIDFANREAPPKQDEDGFYIALAAAFRYSHGRGALAGIEFPATFPDPSSQPGILNLVDVTVNEFGINLAVKAGF